MVSHDNTFWVDVNSGGEESTEVGSRLDRLLAARLPELSRTRIQALVEAGQISDAQGTIIKSASQKVKAGERFAVIIPPLEVSEIQPMAMDLDIIFEDEHLLVINKPAGLTVHPAPGHYQDTLVNALLAHCEGSLSGIGGVARPGIVHRIDKDTSGLLVVAKHDAAHANLARQLKNRTLKRIYHAIIWGVPAYAEGQIEAPIGRNPKDRKKMAVVKVGGKEATTHFRQLDSFYRVREVPGKKGMMQREGFATYMECELETGRTHQIRVHFAHLHFPLIGDPVYGQDTSTRLKVNKYRDLPDELRETLLGFRRQALHARELHLIHPETKEEMTFEAPIPEDFEELLDSLTLLKS